VDHLAGAVEVEGDFLAAAAVEAAEGCTYYTYYLLFLYKPKY